MVILLGASVRAAAVSALRAGLTPWCADLFGDADLMRLAPLRKVSLDAYPRGFIDALADAPAAPVIYTGALENRPDLVGRILAARPLWGNSPDVLRAIRNPSRWTRCLKAAELACPAIADTPPSGNQWLLKPRRSAGGLGILRYAGHGFNRRTHFLQERIDGLATSAVFLGNSDSAILLGITEQLVGAAWLNATGFHYAGSIGPLPLEPATAAHWRAIGAALASTFHLRGLFGVDAILRDGIPWPVEINPRYTASVEILERGSKVPFLLWHRAAFERKAPNPITAPAARATWGKAVLYARATISVPSEGPWDAALTPGVDLDETAYADIPHGGEIIEQGRPVLTLFASADSIDGCRAKLRENAAALDRHLWG